MNRKKIFLVIFLSIIIIFTTVFTTDLIRCRNDQTPIFCIETQTYNDGGSKQYVGLFYNYYSLKIINPEKTKNNDEPEYLTDKVITPWFFNIEYAEKKAFNYNE